MRLILDTNKLIDTDQNGKYTQFTGINYTHYNKREYRKMCKTRIIKYGLKDVDSGNSGKVVYDRLLDNEIEILIEKCKIKDPTCVISQKKRKKLINKNMNMLKKEVIKKIKENKSLWDSIGKICEDLTHEYEIDMIERKTQILNVVPKKIKMGKEYKQFIIKRRLITKLYGVINKSFYYPEHIEIIINKYIFKYFPLLRNKKKDYTVDGRLIIKINGNNKINVIRNSINMKNKRYSVIFLGIKTKRGGHANMILVDHKKKQIVLIEPHGILNNKIVENRKRYHIKKILNKHLNKKYKFLSFKTIIDEGKLKENQGIQTNLGLCVIYSLFITIYLLINVNSNKDNYNLLRDIKQKYRIKKDDNKKLNIDIKKFMYLLYKSYDGDFENIYKNIKFIDKIKKY